MTEPLSVLLVGLPDALARVLAEDESLELRSVDAIADVDADVDAVVLRLAGSPLDALRNLRVVAPEAAVVVVTDGQHEADGAVALHAGADDHLLDDDTLPVLLPRAIRYATALRRLRRELATVDEATGLPNLRGFVPIAEHHLRMADRLQVPVVFVFVRFDDHQRMLQERDGDGAEALARDAASVVLDAVRDADVPARIAPDTVCVLLTGDAGGAETLVLSRLVEAIAVHDAGRERSRSLALSVGTARYEPGSGAGLVEILEGAARGLAARPTS